MYSYSLFAVISTGPSNVFTIAVDCTPFTIISISSFVNSNLLDAFVRYLSFTLIFIIPVSGFMLCIDHTGDTTSTTSWSPAFPPGSFTPIVIVCAILVFPDLSVATPAGMDMLIGPL